MLFSTVKLVDELPPVVSVIWSNVVGVAEETVESAATDLVTADTLVSVMLASGLSVTLTEAPSSVKVGVFVL